MGDLKDQIKKWTVLIAAGVLTACGQFLPILSTDTELTLRGNENWSMQYVIILPGGASLYAQEYQTSLNEIVSGMMSKGIDASWEMVPQPPDETNISYRLRFSGSGYELLNQNIFENPSAVTRDPVEKNRVGFAFDPRNSLFSQGQHNTFTLNGSKIHSTNGTILKDGSVQWVDPAVPMTAVVSTAPDLTWLWIALLAVGGAGFIVAGLGVGGKLPGRLSGLPSPGPVQTTPSVPVQKKFCPHCGTPNPQGAGFCIKCGTQFPSQ